MEKSIVIYYSKTGSNKFLAEKIARNLNCPIEAIRPRVEVFPLMLLSGFTKISAGNHPVKNDLSQFDRVILVGPIWTGQLISPLRNFLKKYKSDIRELHFATCCGSYDEMKDEKFGYAHVFRMIKELVGNENVHCEAFPIVMVLPEDKKEDSELVMNTRLNDENFTGKIENRFKQFLEEVTV
jgi:menaquinone-dependent protoporphyrinogen IX oxidase